MTDALTTTEPFSLTPTSLDEAMKFSEMIHQSEICPKGYKKPGDVLVAIQMGMEVGLPPLQALQNIAVINGRPTLWGDAALAVVQAHPRFIDIEERSSTEALAQGEGWCKILRKTNTGQLAETVRTFTRAEAEAASLWGKQGPWQQYPGRMLQMRARAFAMRDAFADALKGLSIREEVTDFDVIHTTESGTDVMMPRTLPQGATSGQAPAAGQGSPRQDAPAAKPATVVGSAFRLHDVEEVSHNGKTWWSFHLASADGEEVKASTFSESLRDAGLQLIGKDVHADLKSTEKNGRTYVNVTAIEEAIPF